MPSATSANRSRRPVKFSPCSADSAPGTAMPSRPSRRANRHTPSSPPGPIFFWRNNTTKSTPRPQPSMLSSPPGDPGDPDRRHPLRAKAGPPPTTTRLHPLLYPATLADRPRATTTKGGVDVAAVAVVVAAFLISNSVDSNSATGLLMDLLAQTPGRAWSRPGRCRSARLVPACSDLDPARHHIRHSSTATATPTRTLHHQLQHLMYGTIKHSSPL